MPAWLTALAVGVLAIVPRKSVLVAAEVHQCYQSDDYQNGKFGAYPVQRFFSDPDIIAPVANVLVGPLAGVSPSKHMVWSPIGPDVEYMSSRVIDAHDFSMVYQGPRFDKETMGGNVQTCNDTQYLTWWTGHERKLHMAGRYYMVKQDRVLVSECRG